MDAPPRVLGVGKVVIKASKNNCIPSALSERAKQLVVAWKTL
jgi:hypothetical protein